LIRSRALESGCGRLRRNVGSSRCRTAGATSGLGLDQHAGQRWVHCRSRLENRGTDIQPKQSEHPAYCSIGTTTSVKNGGEECGLLTLGLGIMKAVNLLALRPSGQATARSGGARVGPGCPAPCRSRPPPRGTPQALTALLGATPRRRGRACARSGSARGFHPGVEGRRVCQGHC